MATNEIITKMSEWTQVKGVIIFWLTGGGGGGRNGMKDSVKFLIPPRKQQKNVDPPLYLWKFHVTRPPQTTTTKSLLGL